MRLDLLKLSDEQLHRLNLISIETQDDFNKLSENILNATKRNIANLLSNIVSRNPYLCNLFHLCVYLEFINQTLQKNNEISEIILPESDFSKDLGNIFKHKTVKIIKKKKFKLKNKFPLLSKCIDLTILIKIIIRNILLKKRQRVEYFLSMNNVILIDTFILEDSIKRKKYIDRYYNNLLNYLDNDIKQRLFFVPTILGKCSNADLQQIFDNSDENILYKLDILEVSDYFKAFYLIMTSKINYNTKFIFRGTDITSSIFSAYEKKKFNTSTFQGILNYLFIRKLFKKGVKIHLVIDWNENQPIDKGLIKGMHDFFPDSKIIGYQGFIVSLDYNFHLLPTNYEIENGVIPDKIIVVGKKLRERMFRFSRNIDVSSGPAFRFYRKDNIEVENYFRKEKKILLVLPIGLEDSYKLFVSFSKIFSEEKLNYKVLVKLHPSESIEKFMNMLENNLPKHFSITNENFIRLLKNVNLVIGHSSSALLEALRHSIPVIVLVNPYGITQNPIPEEVDNRIWRLCYTKQEVIDAIDYFINLDLKERKEFNKIVQQINRDYFEPVTKENVRKFLEIN